MTLRELPGDNWITIALFAGATAIVVGDFLATLFAVLYQRLWYARRLRPRYRTDATPSCAIVVPCKGVSRDFENNLRCFTRFEYPCYRVVFVTESEADAAVPTIRRVAADCAAVSHVVAGLAAACAQKNHNLLAAVAAAGDVDVYVFADGDIGPRPGWLRELLLPLSDEKVCVTTGFRWLQAPAAGVGQLTHNYINIFIYVLFSAASFMGEVGLWGGSMAIRRRDFESLGIARIWSRAAVDDMSLSRAVARSRRSAVMVPACITVSDDLIQTVRGGVLWFERQIMYLKAYFRGLWFVGGALAVTATAVFAALPVAALLSISPQRTFLGCGGGAVVVFFGGEMLVALLYPLLGRMPYFGCFLVLQPFMRTTHALSFWRTMFTNVITWAGVRYHVGRDGEVTRVERKAP